MPSQVSLDLNFRPVLPRNKEVGIGCIGSGFIMADCHLVAYRKAGLNPVVVDVDAFAVQNMFAINYDVPERETVVLINAGASVVNINILSNGITVFTRDVTIGGNQFTE